MIDLCQSPERRGTDNFTSTVEDKIRLQRSAGWAQWAKLSLLKQEAENTHFTADLMFNWYGFSFLLY